MKRGVYPFEGNLSNTMLFLNSFGKLKVSLKWCKVTTEDALTYTALIGYLKWIIGQTFGFKMWYISLHTEFSFKWDFLLVCMNMVIVCMDSMAWFNQLFYRWASVCLHVSSIITSQLNLSSQSLISSQITYSSYLSSLLQRDTAT